MKRIIIFLCVVVLISACSEKAQKQTDKKLTQEQRDSVLAESPLPGAGAVKKTIAVSDSAAARAQRLDEQMK